MSTISKSLHKKEYITNENLGLVVSIIGWYLRSIHERKTNEQAIKSVHIGTVGDKITFSGTPNCISSYQTDFGTTYIYKFFTR